MSEYTKGPWIFDKRRENLVGENGRHIRVYGAGLSLGGLPDDESRANAILIAAAPELLGALNVMERLVTELYPGHVEPDPEHVGEYQAVWNAVMQSRAAIAKAGG